MRLHVVDNKATRLFIFLSCFFVADTLTAEFMGVKLFSLEKLLGIAQANFSFLGHSGMSFNLTAGVLAWPIVFIMTDIINEYFGPKGVRMITFITLGLIFYAYLWFNIGVAVPPADFWVKSKQDMGINDYNAAYSAVFGQGNLIILASGIAFVTSQFLDVFIFHRIKALTGEKYLWLRSTGSTLVSQLIDSYVVLIIAFYYGSNWPLSLVLVVGVMNYIYKFLAAILSTPIIYLVHEAIERYLGHDLAKELKEEAMAHR